MTLSSPLRLPGATLLTRLKVYDTVGPDGQSGGTPHFHLACSEMYYVLSGSGAVEILDAQGFAKIELTPHAAFVFSPGTLHRLVNSNPNPNGGLELLISMQNSGLPERGDTIATFESELLSDDIAYHKAMRADSLAEAYRRRDDAVDGFLALKEKFAHSNSEGRAALKEMYKQGLARTASKHSQWYDCVVGGAFSEAQDSLQRVLDLTGKRIDRLFEAQHALIPFAEKPTVGFCGKLNRYFDSTTLLPEGVVAG